MSHTEYSAHVISLSELGAGVQKAETEPRVGAAQVDFQGAFKDIGGRKKICEYVLFSSYLYIFVSGKARLKAALRVHITAWKILFGSQILSLEIKSLHYFWLIYLFLCWCSRICRYSLLAAG